MQVPQHLTHILIHALLQTHAHFPTCEHMHTRGQCFVHGQAEQMCHLHYTKAGQSFMVI